MTTTGTFDLNGLDKYLKAIEDAGKDIDEAAATALMVGAKVLQDEMIDLVPKGDTLNLMEHIQIKGPIQEGNLTYVEVGVIHDIAFTDARTAQYGNAQEYGWVSGGKFHPGKSYIRAAIDNVAAGAMALIRASLKRQGKL
jgi:hypothetical protein